MERSTGGREDPRDKAQYQGKKSSEFKEDDQGVLWHKGMICVPNAKELKDKIFREAHESADSIHPGGNKMYRDLKVTYWWYGMKRDVVGYRLLQPLQVPEWKWEEVVMDFIVGMLRI
jgi:hypothetical protein